MKKNRILIAIKILFLACLLVSCKDNPVTPVSGEITGVVTSTSLDGTVTKVPQLKIYLLDLSAKPDTINIENNKKLFIDSTFTDADGNYKFRNLKEGKYGVSPYAGITGILVYKEQSSPDPTSIEISSERQEYAINFSVTYPSEDYPEDTTPFEINVVFKNLTQAIYEMRIERYEFFCFVPLLLTSDFKLELGNDRTFNKVFNYKFAYGWTSLVYTLTNKFRFTFQKNLEEPVYYEYDLTLSSCPATATFEYDFQAKTFTRIN
jgi:hypothetical protein